MQLRGEDVWGENVVSTGQGGVDVFDDELMIVRVPLDTLCVAADGCDAETSRATLVFQRFGTYSFEIQGRDTEFIGQRCSQPSDLGPDASQFAVGVSNLGRLTQVAEKTVKWVQLSDVRPNPPIASAATTRSSRPFVNRKRLMR